MKKIFAGAFLCGTALFASASSLQAADVTYERLQHPEPQNWLMNHHDYSAQRFSSLDAINKSNIKNLKLKFAVADRKSTRLNSSHQIISYAVFCLKKTQHLLRHH